MKLRRIPTLLPVLVIFCSPLFAQTGIIVSIAGTGVPGTAGVGGPAVNAQLTAPGIIAIDSADNLYIPDAGNNRVLRVDGVTGILTLVAGNGTAGSGGDGGPAAQASLNVPYGVALDAAGNLFIAESAGYRVRRVDAQTGIITTVAGNGTAGFSGDGGPAVNASMRTLTGVAFDSAGNMFIADSANARIRRVDAQSGIITTVAGNGNLGVTPDGVLATAASLSPPLGVSVDRSGSPLIYEFGSARIRRVDAVTGILGTFAGNGSTSFTGDGVPATSAGIGVSLANVAIDSAGNYFFADGTGRIRRVDGTSGVITTVAGNGSGPHGQSESAGGGGGSPSCYTTVGDNGPATIATLDAPFGVVLTSNGNLVLSDFFDCRLRRVYLPSPYPYTNTVLTGIPATVPSGQTVTFTATVSPIGAGGVPTGTVTFVDVSLGVTVLGSVPLSGGSASLSISTLPLNAHLIVGYYSGDSSFNGSGSPGVPLNVTPAQQKVAPIITLSSNQNPTPAHTPTIFTVTVTPPAGSTTQPTGSVELYDGATVLGYSSLANGSVQFTASFTTTGTHGMGAAYLGDNNYSQVGASGLSETVNPAITTTTLSSSLSTSTYGQSIVLTASVSPIGASGTVQFQYPDGSVVLGTAPLSGGTAVLAISNLSAGNRTLTAAYSGDSADTPSTSAPLTLTVAKATPSVTLTSNVNPAVSPASVTFVATVSPGSNGVSVQFLDGQTVLGATTLVSGPVSFSTASLTPGTHSITAVCVGDANLNAANSAVLTQTIQASTTVSVTSPGGATSTWGQPVTFAASVTPAAATGTVQFADGPTTIGTATIAGGTASLTMPSLSVGNHPIQATYNGDGIYLANSSAVWVQTVNKAATSVTVASSANPSVAGQLISLSATVSPAAATGSVQFLDGATVVGTATVTNGFAYVMTSALTAGAHTLTSVYSGDANYAGSTSSALTQTVKTASSTSIGTDISPVVYGQQVTIMSWVTPSAATGTVQFTDGTTVLATVTVSGGTANFPISTLSTGTHLISAAYSGDASYGNSTSPPMTLIIGKAPAIVALTSSLNPAVSGQSVTFAATVAPGTATGTVQFLDGATVLGTAPISGGAASLSTASLSAGSHNITASYSGDGNYNSASAALTQTVKATTVTTLSANSTSIALGQSVQVTASVVPAAATGTVQFLDGASALGAVTLSGGAAVLPVPNLAVGSHNLTAFYSGDGNDTPSTSAAVVVTVSKANSSVTLTSSQNPAVSGQAVTFTATVTPSAATGTVQFLDGATALGTATISGGTAAFSTSSLSAGSHSITAAYSGDGNYNSASAALTQAVKATTSTTLTANNTSITLGQPVQLTASVVPAAATGTVQFLDGATALGSVTLTGGGAALAVSSLAVGAHNLTAVYSGDGNDAPSTSAAVVVTVSKANSSVTVTSSLNPSVSGQPVTFTATVTPSAATGTVQFLDGATALGTATISGGTASLSTSSLSAGSHSITASYSGDGNYNTASATLTQAVKAATTTTLTANNTSIVLGQSVQLTASVVPAAATGTVQFLDGASALGTVTLSGGAAGLAVLNLAVGTHNLTAVYSGDGNDVPSTSAAVVVTVSKANSSATAASSLNLAVSGQTVTFTATVTPGTATGTVQFKDGATVLGTVTVSGGAAAFATSTLAAGSHSITAVYSGDGNYNASTSSVLTETITAPLPGAPSNLTATAASTSQINLSWTASPTSGVTYNVYSSTTSGFTPGAGNRIATGVSGTTYAHTGLAPSSTHYYVVTAQNANGESAGSNQASATTDSTVAGCHVDYHVTTQSNVGFGTAITIQNKGRTAVNGWNLTWTWSGNQQITQSWDSNYSQTGANASLTNTSFNPTIGAGSTITGIGFNASYSGQNQAPHAFYLNGTPCN
ncbi:NHL repeat containing protein [Candidatus Sulfopaludibacter sp. SbA4]|nr:NHL repeat containing protein [Candidatus Sulfopaludibacter sp. SbA4]